MLHKEFWGLLFLGFVAWIFVTANPSERIERVCRPVGWGGNVVVSLSALAAPDEEKVVQGWFNKLEYGCRYMTWRLVYQTAWNQSVAAQKQDAATAASIGDGTSAATPATASAAPAASAAAAATPASVASGASAAGAAR
jgi:hypothetical protein